MFRRQFSSACFLAFNLIVDEIGESSINEIRLLSIFYGGSIYKLFNYEGFTVCFGAGRIEISLKAE